MAQPRMHSQTWQTTGAARAARNQANSHGTRISNARRGEAVRQIEQHTWLCDVSMHMQHAACNVQAGVGGISAPAGTFYMPPQQIDRRQHSRSGLTASTTTLTRCMHVLINMSTQCTNIRQHSSLVTVTTPTCADGHAVSSASVYGRSPLRRRLCSPRRRLGSLRLSSGSPEHVLLKVRR